MLTYEILQHSDARTTNALIDHFRSNADFAAFAKSETAGILRRDEEDAEKLAAGVAQAVARGVLPSDPPVERTCSIDVLGKSVDEVCAIILRELGDAPTFGCVMLLSGLSGTGKGTTVELLKAKLPNAVTWSNGNVFRALTLLSLEHCEQQGVPLSEELLTPALLASMLTRLRFGKFGGGAGGAEEFDITIDVAGGPPLLISEIQNTLLKEAKIGKHIPTVARMCQGEVVQFAAAAAEAMRSAGKNVLIEGRKQTLDYVRTPHRFELALSEPNVIGQRRAAQRVMAAAVEALKAAPTTTAETVAAACQRALAKLWSGGGGGAGGAVSGAATTPITPTATNGHYSSKVESRLREVAASVSAHDLQQRLASTVHAALTSGAEDPLLHIAAGLLAHSTAAAGLAPILGPVLRDLSMPGAATATGASSSASAHIEWLTRQLAASRDEVGTDTYIGPVTAEHEIKCDEFDSIHLLKCPRPHPMVWNFRRAGVSAADNARLGNLGPAPPPACPVFGMGQCHVDGIGWVLGELHRQGFQKVICCNMREEPVVFIGGKACAPRVPHDMNENVTYLAGISGHELAAMELSFKAECLATASKNDPPATLDVFFQVAGGANRRTPLPASAESTLSVAEAYARLAAQPNAPASVEYHRLPIADETAPPEEVLTELVELLQPILGSVSRWACRSVPAFDPICRPTHGGATENGATGRPQNASCVIFNCQMGRGRTTTGMAVAVILCRGGDGTWAPPTGAPTSLPAPTASGRDLSKGEFSGVLRLLNLLDDYETILSGGGGGGGGGGGEGTSLARQPSGLGVHAKLLADQCIEECSEAQHLVTAIAKCKESAANAAPTDARNPEFWTTRGAHYLERYACLVCFAAYVLTSAGGGGRGENGAKKKQSPQSFTAWFRQNWQLKRAINESRLD